MKNQDPGNVGFILIASVTIVCFLIPAFYAARAGAINAPLLALAKYQLKFFVPFSQEARTVWEHITGLDPASLTWERMSAILSYTGRWVRWPFALFLVLLGFMAVNLGRVGNFTRRLNMESLLRHNAESFACLLPVVGRGKDLLDPKSYDAGPWRIARSPLQFAVENELLTDDEGKALAPDQFLRDGLGHADAPAFGKARLDEQKTLTILLAQLGPAFWGVSFLTPHRKALAAAFLAYADGEKEAGVNILDLLSRSYVEQDGKPGCPVLPVLEDAGFQKRVDAAFKRHESILADSLIERHTAFELPWFMALLTRARKKGVLASSQFLWLRPLDRTLWYALHQCGGRAAWAEGFAAWAHYTAEEKTGKALADPHVAPAVASLREALNAQGWLTDKALPVPAVAPVPVLGNPAPITKPNNPALKQKLKVPKPVAVLEPDAEIIYAPAEDIVGELNEEAEYMNLKNDVC